MKENTVMGYIHLKLSLPTLFLLKCLLKSTLCHLDGKVCTAGTSGSMVCLGPAPHSHTEANRAAGWQPTGTARSEDFRVVNY